MKQIIEQKRSECHQEKFRLRKKINQTFLSPEEAALYAILCGKLQFADDILAEIKPCVWTKNKERGWWKTSCGRLANYKEKFCPYCGMEIEEAEHGTSS